MRVLLLLVLGLVLAAGVPVSAQDKAELTTWTNHDSLRSPETARADWQPRGKGSTLEVTAKGLLLPGNSRMASTFQLADGGRITFVYVTRNRNGIVRLCGKELKAKAPERKGADWYVLDIVRQGQAVSWGVSVADAAGRPVGRPVKADAIQIDAAEVGKPTRVVFASEPVGGRGDANSIADIRFKRILVSGPVLPATVDEKEKK